ncbi:Alpha carbonic anhydrase [Trinorchestia longiramus]|nr:Alpha carbonic anhydrase [Trinorchestia longiramus]
MMVSWSLLLLLFIAVKEGNPAVEFSYKAKEDWPLQFPVSCAGKRQSPINIDRFSVRFSHWLRIFTLSFTNYETIPENQIAVNNGHGLQVMHDSMVPPTIRGGGLHGTYSLSQYHFHWGSDSSRGSEHTIDSVRYPMEMHLVHYKTEYGSMRNAVRYSDGVTVLAVMFEVSTRDNPALAPILQQVQNIKNGRDSPMTRVPAPYAVASLLPDDTRKFYYYEGSVTTPPCNEVVIWIIFKETLHISQAQLEQFRELLDSEGQPIVDNFRDPQPLNFRRIQSSYPNW